MFLLYINSVKSTFYVQNLCFTVYKKLSNFLAETYFRTHSVSNPKIWKPIGKLETATSIRKQTNSFQNLLRIALLKENWTAFNIETIVSEKHKLFKKRNNNNIYSIITALFDLFVVFFD